MYNNKEFEKEGGVYFYGARLYAPVIGRWAGVDPLAEKYPAWSTFNYVLGNPISNIDPDGRSVENEYVRDKKTGMLKQVGNKGGEEVDYFYEGRISEDGQTAIWSGDEEKGAKPYPRGKSGDGFSDEIGGADGVFTFIGGFGFNNKAFNRYGNTGSRFRAKLFGTNLALKGSVGSKIVTGIKILGPALSMVSIGYSLTSNQSTGAKLADTGASLYGVFGGPIGAAVSIGYSFGIKPLYRVIALSTPEEDAYRHHMQVKYCNKPKKCN